MNYLGTEYFGHVFGETVDYQSDVIVVGGWACSRADTVFRGAFVPVLLKLGRASLYRWTSGADQQVSGEAPYAAV